MHHRQSRAVTGVPVTGPGRSASDVLSELRREEHSRLLATLTSRFGDLDLAEDAAQDALAAALETWPRTGVPDSPLAWLTTTATRRAIDRLRRERSLLVLGGDRPRTLIGVVGYHVRHELLDPRGFVLVQRRRGRGDRRWWRVDGRRVVVAGNELACRLVDPID